MTGGTEHTDFVLNGQSVAIEDFGDWLPTVGDELILTFTATPDSGFTVVSVVTTLGTSTSYDGQYTNDPVADTGPDYNVSAANGVSSSTVTVAVSAVPDSIGP